MFLPSFLQARQQYEVGSQVDGVCPSFQVCEEDMCSFVCFVLFYKISCLGDFLVLKRNFSAKSDCTSIKVGGRIQDSKAHVWNDWSQFSSSTFNPGWQRGAEDRNEGIPEGEAFSTVSPTAGLCRPGWPCTHCS